MGGIRISRETATSDKESEDVIVDGNENDHHFGPNQYSESDVASAAESNPREPR